MMTTTVEPQTRDEAVELAETVASEIDTAIQLDRAGDDPVREFLTVKSPTLAGQAWRKLDELTYDFHSQVTFLKATRLMRKYRMHLVVSGGSYTGDVDLQLLGTGIED
jgi:hypothetical protein